MLLILVLVRGRIFVVVPEVRVLHHINYCNQIVIRITLLVKPEIHIDLLTRLEANCHNVPVVVRFLMAVVICHLTSIKCNYMTFKCFIVFCYSRLYKRINFLCCHNISFLLLFRYFHFATCANTPTTRALSSIYRFTKQ